MNKSESQEFKEKKKLIELERELLTEKHKLKLEEYDKEVESHRKIVNMDLEKHRIITADKRREQEKKFQDIYYMHELKKKEKY